MIDRHLAQKLLSNKEYGEIRYHKRTSRQFMTQKARVDVAHYSTTEGVGIRILHQGRWGFAATTDLTDKGLRKAIKDAEISASVLPKRTIDAHFFRQQNVARDDFVCDGYEETLHRTAEETLAQLIKMERSLAAESAKISVSRVRYAEIFEDKVIITSDGANAAMRLLQPEISISAIAEHKGEKQSAAIGAGILGGWSQLIKHDALSGGTAYVAKLAIDLLSAGYAEGGKKKVILSPGVVGLLCHEAIGHTVEADFVRSGSVAAGKIGKRVGSPLVTMIDSGYEKRFSAATGGIPFDDEGIISRPVTIIENGILKNYLHNRESAAQFGVQPTGSARAWLYEDEPLIRMRNTYFAAGTDRLETMMDEIEDGYLVEGSGSGQADANGEFMFGASHMYRIHQGKKKELVREATLSGIAFDVLRSVDGVSRDFAWDMGTGYCGKGQPAKVDAGGPFVRCTMHVGGR